MYYVPTEATTSNIDFCKKKYTKNMNSKIKISKQVAVLQDINFQDNFFPRHVLVKNRLEI